MRELTHIYRVRTGIGLPSKHPVPNPVRAALFGRRCRVVCTGRLGSVLIEMEDGSRVVTMRRAVRRLPDA